MRSFRTLVSCGIAVIVLHLSFSSSAQQVFPSFGEVDFFYSQDPQRFHDLWLAARSQTVRIAVLGDSQESSPTSHGFRYIPLLNYELWKRFGNSPETPIEGCFHYGGGSSPPSNWLVSGRCAVPGPVDTRLGPARILPSVRARAFSTLSSATNITGGNRGQLTMLQHDAIDVDPSTGIPTHTSYFNTSGVVKARIFAATHPSSGEVAYQARPSTTPTPAYSAAVATTGTLDLGLQSPTFAVRSGVTSALDFGGKQYMALEVFGTSDTELTDIVGLRFYNETHPQGIVVDSFSLGGYSASWFLRDHADAGDMFAALGFQAAIIHYGANTNGRATPEQFKSDISAVISRVRAWIDDPQFPVILIADVYQSRLTPEQLVANDQYVGAQLAIAQADSSVMVINARRLTEAAGWNPTSGLSDRFLEDGVHYTALGAKVLSAAVVAAMLGEIHASGCLNDSGAVSLQSTMTLVVDLGGTTACTGHGQLSVAQPLQLNGPALKVVLTNGFVPAAGNHFKILSFPAASGSFGSMTLPELEPGLSWNTSALYTEGRLAVAGPSLPPQPIPTAPTITVTAGASQTVTPPDVPSSIEFVLAGSGRLTVSASSSNQTLLPNSGIAISAGCGQSILSCAATLDTAQGQAGMTTVALTVTDTHGHSAMTTATLQVSASGPPPPEPGTGSASDGGRGGGGSSDLLSSLLIAAIMLSCHCNSRLRHRRRTVVDTRGA